MLLMNIFYAKYGICGHDSGKFYFMCLQENRTNSLVRLKNITFSIAYSLEEYSASRNMIFDT